MLRAVLLSILVSLALPLAVLAQSVHLGTLERPVREASQASARDLSESEQAASDQGIYGEVYKQEFTPSPLTSIFGDDVDLKPTFNIRGRIETDAIRAVQSAQSIATIGDMQNGYGFRRVRLGAFGQIGDVASWISEVELAGNSVRLRDVFIGFETLPNARQVRVGQFREPYSLEGMTSSNFLTFMERGPTNVLSPARNWGVCGYWHPDDEMWLFTLGLFRDGTQSSGQSLGDDEAWAGTARLTGLLVYDDGEESDSDGFRLLHVGGALSQRTPPNDTIDFSPRTGSSLLTVEDNPGSPYLPSLVISSNSYQLYNLQAASVNGPFSLQWEWLATSIQQTNGGPIFIHGTYVYGSYFLTGEHRGYDFSRGAFGQVDVLRPLTRSRRNLDRGFGAIELGVRFSYFNMNSPNLPLDVNGAPAQTVLYELTTGLNWYLNSNLRLMFDYTAGMPDDIAVGSTVAHIFGARAALYW